MFHLLYGHHPSSFPQSLVVTRSEFACISHVLVAGYHQKEYLAADDARCRPRQEIHVFRLARPALSRNSLSFFFHPSEGRSKPQAWGNPACRRRSRRISCARKLKPQAWGSSACSRRRRRSISTKPRAIPGVTRVLPPTY